MQILKNKETKITFQPIIYSHFLDTTNKYSMLKYLFICIFLKAYLYNLCKYL